MKISLVIPCFNENENISSLIEQLTKIGGMLPSYSLEFLFIDDGSTDGTLKTLKKFCEERTDVKYISLSRNFGKESAMLAGLAHAVGDYVGIMDSDLQHPPEMIPEFVKALENGYDVAATKRSVRTDTSKNYNLGANIFYRLLNSFGDDVHLENGVQDFRLMKKQVVKSILSLPESSRFSKGIFSWVGYKTYYFDAIERPRHSGTTKWSFMKSLKYGLDGLLAFSTAPLRLSIYIGIFTSLIGFLYALYVVVKTLVYGVDLPGFATIVCLVLILGGLNLLSLGVLGEYIGRIYKETKRRPHYLIRESSFTEEGDEDDL